MDTAFLIDRLEDNVAALRPLIESVGSEQAAWKPSPGAWSILEITAHLADEEVKDFRARLESTLADPTADWAPIDPEGWVSARRYAERELQETFRTFVFERAVSVAWLRGLASPDWTKVHPHPRGSLAAGDLLASWVAHDLLHVSQLARRHWEFAEQRSEPFSVCYAGDV